MQSLILVARSMESVPAHGRGLELMSFKAPPNLFKGSTSALPRQEFVGFRRKWKFPFCPRSGFNVWSVSFSQFLQAKWICAGFKAGGRGRCAGWSMGITQSCSSLSAVLAPISLLDMGLCHPWVPPVQVRGWPGVLGASPGAAERRKPLSCDLCARSPVTEQLLWPGHS